jgi:hypothetical protein
MRLVGDWGRTYLLLICRIDGSAVDPRRDHLPIQRLLAYEALLLFAQRPKTDMKRAEHALRSEMNNQ